MKPFTLLVVIAALFVGACKDKGTDKDSKASASATAEASSAGTQRPTSITDEMNATFGDFVVAFEKFAADIGKAGSDCHRALEVAQQHLRSVTAMAARGDELREQMAQAGDDAGPWFGKTYGPRMAAAAKQLGTLEVACAGDAELKAAVNQVVGQFPMMRRKD